MTNKSTECSSLASCRTNLHIDAIFAKNELAKTANQPQESKFATRSVLILRPRQDLNKHQDSNSDKRSWPNGSFASSTLNAAWNPALFGTWRVDQPWDGLDCLVPCPPSCSLEAHKMNILGAPCPGNEAFFGYPHLWVKRTSQQF